MTIFNGYQYKITPQGQSWEESQSICKRWGGDLAVYGVQNMESRRYLKEFLIFLTQGLAMFLFQINSPIGTFGTCC